MAFGYGSSSEEPVCAGAEGDHEGDATGKARWAGDVDHGEAPDPTARPGEVLIDIQAASVNAADYKVRLGGGRHGLVGSHILGRDFSGVVSMVGAGVTISASGTMCLE